MERIISLLLAVCLIFPMIGCSSGETESTAPATEAESTEAAAPAETAEPAAEEADQGATEAVGAEQEAAETVE